MTRRQQIGLAIVIVLLGIAASAQQPAPQKPPNFEALYYRCQSEAYAMAAEQKDGNILSKNAVKALVEKANPTLTLDTETWKLTTKLKGDEVGDVVATPPLKK